MKGHLSSLPPVTYRVQSIKTASGKTVTFSLSSQSDGLGVQATVDGGEFTADELKAVGQLGGAFQAAVDGLTAMPPRLDLSNLTQFDSNVLASVDLNAKLKTSAGQDQTLAFHADSQSRSTRMSGPDGELDLSVDLKNAAILGSARQQAKALKSYLAQFDRVQERGNAKAQALTPPGAGGVQIRQVPHHNCPLAVVPSRGVSCAIFAVAVSYCSYWF